jgi:hypothetical protein
MLRDHYGGTFHYLPMPNEIPDVYAWEAACESYGATIRVDES